MAIVITRVQWTSSARQLYDVDYLDDRGNPQSVNGQTTTGTSPLHDAVDAYLAGGGTVDEPDVAQEKRDELTLAYRNISLGGMWARNQRVASTPEYGVRLNAIEMYRNSRSYPAGQQVTIITMVDPATQERDRFQPNEAQFIELWEGMATFWIQCDKRVDNIEAELSLLIADVESGDEPAAKLENWSAYREAHPTNPDGLPLGDSRWPTNDVNGTGGSVYFDDSGQ